MANPIICCIFAANCNYNKTMGNTQEILATIIIAWLYIYIGYVIVNTLHSYTEEEMYTYMIGDILLWPLIILIWLADEIVEDIKDLFKKD